MNNSLVVANISSDNIDFGIEKKRNCDSVLENLMVPMLKLPKRILLSFTPPLNYNRPYLYTDFIGPTLSTLVLVSLLQYGFSRKRLSIPYYSSSSFNVACTVLSYYALLSFSIVLASRVVRAKLKILDVATLIGYSFYGFILTLSIPLILRIVHDYVFYSCLILFGGLSCIRVLLILLFTIEVPVARFLICSVIGNMHILFTIYLYYCYIHPTYMFGATNTIDKVT